MTDEDRKEIRQIVIDVVEEIVPPMIDKKITEFALKTPSMISKLVMESTTKIKMYQEFLKDNNYLKTSHAELVARIVGDIEKEYPGKPYSYILEQAKPVIRDRLKLLANTNFENPKRPTDLVIKKGDIPVVTTQEGDLGTI